MRRHLIHFTILAISIFALLTWYQIESNPRHRAFGTGYILLGSLFFLAAYNLRKKLPFVPWLGSSRFWMQLHIHVGLGTFALFACHIGFKIPSGLLESILAAVYLIVAGSGVYGLYLTRRVPRKLTLVGDEVIYEQIPYLRKQLANNVRAMMESTLEQSETLARFYVNRLAPFFEQPRPVGYLICPTSRQSRQLQNEIAQLDRYLNREHRNLGAQLIDQVRRKDNLDYHRAMQGRLKYWLFLHVGLTYSLLIFAVVHGIMAHAFHGGIR